MSNDLKKRILAGALVTAATTNSIGVIAIADEITEDGLKINSEGNELSDKVEIEEKIEIDIKNDDIETEEEIKEEEAINEIEISEFQKIIEGKSIINFPVTHSIMGQNEVSKEQFKSYLLAKQKQYGFKYDISVSIDEFLRIAYEEAALEGVRGDILVAQAVHESGYFKFGGVLTAADNNFCGLGVTGDGSKLSFPSARIGIRAQVQHLKAYGSKAALNQAVVDPRFKYVTRGVATSLEELAGKWAVPGYDKSKYSSLQSAADNDASYGQRIYHLIRDTKSYSGTALDGSSSTEQKPSEPEVKPDVPTTTARGEVVNISTSLNIRKGPGSNYAVIGSLKNTQKINIYGEENGFYKIDFIAGGKTEYGYASKNYINKYDNSPSLPSVPEVKPETPEVKPDIPSIPDNTVTVKMGQVTGISTSLNIRAGSGTTYKIVGFLKNGEKVNVQGEENGFYKIATKDINGYVSKNYMKIIEETQSTPIENPSNNQNKVGTVKVNGSLNIRSGAGTNCSIVGRLYNGNKVNIIGESGSWYKINYSGRVVYVSKNYIY